MSDIYLLRSTGIGDDSRKQGLHTDYDPESFGTLANGKPKTMAFSALFSIMEGTHLWMSELGGGEIGIGGCREGRLDIPPALVWNMGVQLVVHRIVPDM